MTASQTGNPFSRDEDERAIRAIVARASHDRDFRDALLTDPRGAIERAYGVIIPPTFRVRFIEKESDLDALVVLPDFAGDEAPPPELLPRAPGAAADAASAWWRPVIN